MTSAVSESHTAPDLAALLWDDERILFDRHSKTAASLIALRRVLAARLADEPAVREFLALFAVTEQLPGKAFTRVWLEPAAYYWVRTAYDLAGQILNPISPGAVLKDSIEILGAGDPLAALRTQLQAFKHFVLGACHAAGQDLRLATPLQAQLPCPVMGTPLYLDGTGSVRILGLEAGTLLFDTGGGTQRLTLDDIGACRDGVMLARCPVIEHGECVLHMQPCSLDWPGVDFVAPVSAAGIGFQRDNAPRIAEALTLMQRYAPVPYAQFTAFMSNIVLKPLSAGLYSNLSHSDFPGMAVIGFYNNPYMLADALIHELAHNRLFCVEETGAFFSGPDHLEGPRCYSPWRQDPRPMHGLYHAVYVHLSVGEFWLRRLAEGEHRDTDVVLFARDRLMRLLLQCRIGIRLLETHARLTVFGSRILAHMQERVDDLQRRARALELRFDTPAMQCRLSGDIVPEKSAPGTPPPTVADSIRRHIRDYDSQGHCQSLLADPALPGDGIEAW